MTQRPRNLKNPWPRMALACFLTIWAGANLWSAIFRWSDIMVEDYASRTTGLFLSILFSVLPLVVAIYLFWTIVVGPEDPVAKGKAGKRKS